MIGIRWPSATRFAGEVDAVLGSAEPVVDEADLVPVVSAGAGSAVLVVADAVEARVREPLELGEELLRELVVFLVVFEQHPPFSGVQVVEVRPWLVLGRERDDLEPVSG